MSEEPLDDLVWLTPLRPQRGLLEPWLRRAAVAPDGLVFVPAALAGNETMVHLAAAWENDVPTIYDDARHAYIPSHWVADTFPSSRPRSPRPPRPSRASPRASPSRDDQVPLFVIRPRLGLNPKFLARRLVATVNALQGVPDCDHFVRAARAAFTKEPIR